MVAAATPQRTPAKKLSPLERIERSMNGIASVVVGHLDQLAMLPGHQRTNLLRRLRSLNGHLAQLEKALMAQAAEGSGSVPPRRAEVSGW